MTDATARSEFTTPQLPPPGPRAQDLFAQPGPFTPQTDVITHIGGRSPYGALQTMVLRLGGNHAPPRMTRAFPQGLASPIGVKRYAPAEIADLGPVPAIIWVPGIDADPGMYDELARLWASHGYAVLIPYNFFNSLLDVPLLGLATLLAAERDPNGPWHGRIDLSRILLGGHSAGGQASLQAAAVLPRLMRWIRPEVRFTGVVAWQPGPLALGSLVRIPALILTARYDPAVPDSAWPRRWQYNLMRTAPSYLGKLDDTSHFSGVDDLDHNLNVGITTAFWHAFGKNAPSARHFFIGDDWLMHRDPSFARADRNAIAAALPR